MKEQTCCFTGHRNLLITYELKRKLKFVVEYLINEKDVLYFGMGGAIGFDTLAALTILELRVIYPKIKVILVLPCPQQDKFWKKGG